MTQRACVAAWGLVAALSTGAMASVLELRASVEPGRGTAGGGRRATATVDARLKVEVLLHRGITGWMPVRDEGGSVDLSFAFVPEEGAVRGALASGFIPDESWIEAAHASAVPQTAAVRELACRDWQPDDPSACAGAWQASVDLSGLKAGSGALVITLMVERTDPGGRQRISVSSVIRLQLKARLGDAERVVELAGLLKVAQQEDRHEEALALATELLKASDASIWHESRGSALLGLGRTELAADAFTEAARVKTLELKRRGMSSGEAEADDDVQRLRRRAAHLPGGGH